MLRPFGIISETVHPDGQPHGNGYKRTRFEEAWAAYLPGRNDARGQFGDSDPCNRANADETGTSRDFRSVREDAPHGSKNANLSNNDGGLHACTDRKAGNGGAQHEFGQGITPPPRTQPNGVDDQTCAQCRGRADGKERQVAIGPKTVWLHPDCERFYRRDKMGSNPTPQAMSATADTGTQAASPKAAPASDLWKDLGIPEFLDRSRERVGPPAIASGPDDDLGDFK
jgi:hypothetical protein